MLWLKMDQPAFKKSEIGSHRKYSNPSKNAATVHTFRSEFAVIFNWLNEYLALGRYACFVVGDSTLRGERINNAELISSVAHECGGYREVARIPRTMQSHKKAFNPAIGKIKAEEILILERA
jgi:site-specific DNA-methyltransferase (cytosine-N4-specific)